MRSCPLLPDARPNMRSVPGRSASGRLGGVLGLQESSPVGVVEPPLREYDVTRAALSATRLAELGHGERLVGIQPGQQLVQRRQRGDQGQRVAELTTRAEALEVP